MRKLIHRVALGSALTLAMTSLFTSAPAQNGPDA